MTTLTMNSISFVSKLMNVFTQYTQYRKQIQVMRQTVKELNSLTDRELHDIGLSRCDIYDVAKSQAKL